MTADVCVIPPDKFQARAGPRAVCSPTLAESLLRLFAAHDCFKDELPPASSSAHGHGHGHGHGRGGGGWEGGGRGGQGDRGHGHGRGGGGGGRGGHGHGRGGYHGGGGGRHGGGGRGHGPPPDTARPLKGAGLTHVERLHREVTALLNKINGANAHAIEVKVLRLLEPANANIITRAVLHAAVVQGAYMRHLVALLKRVAGKYDIAQELAASGAAFAADVAAGLGEAAGLDYKDYDGFCRFTKLKAQLLARQQLQFALAAEALLPEAERGPDALAAHCAALAGGLGAYAAASNQHMTGVALALLAAAVSGASAPAVRREVLAAVEPVYDGHRDAAGKKNAFEMEALMAACGGRPTATTAAAATHGRGPTVHRDCRRPAGPRSRGRA